MPAATAGDITALLRAWSEGDAIARDRLVGLVYPDLLRLADARLRGEASPTLNPSDLVQEAFIRLLDQETRWTDRTHFFAIAAMTIRRVLVDRARAHRALKRSGAAVHVDLGEFQAAKEQMQVDVIALDQALGELAGMDHRQAQVVELRYFGGLSFEEIAKTLKISLSTAKRDWTSARLWLHWRLRGVGRRRPGAT